MIINFQARKLRELTEHAAYAVSPGGKPTLPPKPGGRYGSPLGSGGGARMSPVRKSSVEVGEKEKNEITIPFFPLLHFSFLFASLLFPVLNLVSLFLCDF